MTVELIIRLVERAFHRCHLTLTLTQSHSVYRFLCFRCEKFIILVLFHLMNLIFINE